MACLVGLIAALVDAKAASQTCLDGHIDRVLGGAVPRDLTELLVTTEVVSEGLAHKDDARQLDWFMETSVWQKALGKPQPHPATLREAVSTQWAGGLDTLKKNGPGQILQLQTLAVWSDSEPTPQFASPADNESPPAPAQTGSSSSRGATVSARFRIANVGHEPVSALSLVFFGVQAPGQSGVESKECRWRPIDPLGPGQSREIVCHFGAPREQLAQWRNSIETRAMPKFIAHFWLGSTISNVSFREQGRDIPYIPYSSLRVAPVDPEIARAASERVREVCRPHVPGDFPNPFDVFFWVLAPGILGIRLGMRFAR